MSNLFTPEWLFEKPLTEIRSEFRNIVDIMDKSSPITEWFGDYSGRSKWFWFTVKSPGTRITLEVWSRTKPRVLVLERVMRIDKLIEESTEWHVPELKDAVALGFEKLISKHGEYRRKQSEMKQKELERERVKAGNLKKEEARAVQRILNAHKPKWWRFW